VSKTPVPFFSLHKPFHPSVFGFVSIRARRRILVETASKHMNI
jgi:hypothetical protein